MMNLYTVQYFDEATWDDAVVFTGTLAQCREWLTGDYDDLDEFFIVAPDGYTVVD